MDNNKKSILIIDDSVLITERLIAMLHIFKNEVIIKSAETCIKAISILKESLVDIILLDINLQGENGIELLKVIKKNYPSVKVIMCTNKSGNYYKTLCIKFGADFFIDKSREFEQLPSVISSFI